MKKTKAQKIRLRRIQKITFIGMAILMGIIQYLDIDGHDYKVNIGHITITIKI